jgi:glutathione S-transferase
LSLEETNRKETPLTLVDQKNVTTDTNAISMRLAGSSALLGHTPREQVEVYSWLEYYNMELHLPVQ